MSNYLILRTLTSPYNDVTKGSVLSHPELDGNFIFLKGNIIYTAETIGATVTLKNIMAIHLVLLLVVVEFLLVVQ